jgi:hypothetical protein
MSVTEAQRHQLFESAKAAFGESSAEIFMNMNPNVEWENLATKTDLERFATKEDLERFATKEDLERFATKTELAELEARLMRHFTTVLVGTQGTMLVALSLVFTLALALS